MLKEKVQNSELLTEDQKKMILFVLDRQFIIGECVVTNDELSEELDIDIKTLAKVTKELRKTKFFKSGGESAGNGSYRPNVGYFSFRNVAKGKRLSVNEILLNSFLDNKELGIEKIQKKHG